MCAPRTEAGALDLLPTQFIPSPPRFHVRVKTIFHIYQDYINACTHEALNVHMW